MATQKIRTKHNTVIEVEEFTRTEAIKAFCTECLGFGECHPNECSDSLCPLFNFRGINRVSYYENTGDYNKAKAEQSLRGKENCKFNQKR